MSWWKGNEQSRGNDGNTDGLELKPEEVKAKLDKIDTLEDSIKTSVSADMDEKLKPMNEFIARMNAADEATRQRKVRENQQQQQQNNEVDDIDFVTDPREATRKMLAPTNQALMTLAARAVKTEVLSELEYYTGDIKAKVDTLVGQQSLQNQADPAVVRNCYKVILADHITDISEGKLKTRAQAASFSGNGTGGHSGRENEEGEEKLSADEEAIASKFGMTSKEWTAAKKEVHYV